MEYKQYIAPVLAILFYESTTTHKTPNTKFMKLGRSSVMKKNKIAFRPLTDYP